jgi:hypothetical protein
MRADKLLPIRPEIVFNHSQKFFDWIHDNE